MAGSRNPSSVIRFLSYAHLHAAGMVAAGNQHLPWHLWQVSVWVFWREVGGTTTEHGWTNHCVQEEQSSILSAWVTNSPLAEERDFIVDFLSESLGIGWITFISAGDTQRPQPRVWACSVYSNNLDFFLFIPYSYYNQIFLLKKKKKLVSSMYCCKLHHIFFFFESRWEVKGGRGRGEREAVNSSSTSCNVQGLTQVLSGNGSSIFWGMLFFGAHQ